MYWVFICRDHFVHALSQWEMMLHFNIVPHWLNAYTKWYLIWTNKIHITNGKIIKMSRQTVQKHWSKRTIDFNVRWKLWVDVMSALSVFSVITNTNLQFVIHFIAWNMHIMPCSKSVIILGMGLANERRRYIVTPPLIGRAYTQIDPCWSMTKFNVQYVP